MLHIHIIYSNRRLGRLDYTLILSRPGDSYIICDNHNIMSPNSLIDINLSG